MGAIFGGASSGSIKKSKGLQLSSGQIAFALAAFTQLVEFALQRATA
jgi:hypothetical protein